MPYGAFAVIFTHKEGNLPVACTPKRGKRAAVAPSDQFAFKIYIRSVFFQSAKFKTVKRRGMTVRRAGKGDQ